MVKADTISPSIDMQSLFVTVSLYLYQPIKIENTAENRLGEDTKATFPIEAAWWNVSKVGRWARARTI